MKPAIEKSLLSAYALCAVVMLAFVVYCILLSMHQGPFRDMWIALDTIRPFLESGSGQDGHFADLFSLHGGAHRLFFPRLFFLAEYGIFSGTNTFLIISSFLLQASVVFLVWRMLRDEQHMSRDYRLFLTAMTLLLMFNATQLENFLYTFDMQWFLTTATAVWALAGWVILFGGLAEKKPISPFLWVLSSLATVVSLFSSFSGLCVLLVLPCLALAYRLSRRYLSLVLLVTLVGVTAYVQGPFGSGENWGAPADTVKPWAGLELLFSLLLLWLKWIALYFGSPLGREHPELGALFAYGSLFFLAWQWIILLAKGVHAFTRFQIFCLSIALFAAIVGIATGWGRMYFVNTANEDRYQSIVLVYWLGIFGFSLSRALMIADEQRRLFFKRCVLALIVFWTLVIIPVASIRDAQAQINFFDRVNNTNFAIATGQWEFSVIRDTLILGDKTKKINRPEMHALFLHEKGLGIFASPEDQLLGTLLDRRFISADACEGEILSVEPVGSGYGGYRLSGRGYDVIREALPKDYVVIDEEGLVMGLGRLQRQKNSLWPRTWQSPDESRWLAYTVDLPPLSTVLVLAARADGGYCRVVFTQLPGQ